MSVFKFWKALITDLEGFHISHSFFQTGLWCKSLVLDCKKWVQSQDWNPHVVNALGTLQSSALFISFLDFHSLTHSFIYAIINWVSHLILYVFAPSFIKHVMNTSSRAGTVICTWDTDPILVFRVHAPRYDKTHAPIRTRNYQRGDGSNHRCRNRQLW